ncbi:MAG: hypothetical protein J5563_01910 [Clostridia bacterium]|nr:hypothetical protein [Clostridia bacterium]
MRKITSVLLIISMLACMFLSSCRTAETPAVPQTSGTEAAPAQETDPVPPETTAAPVSPDTEEPVTTEEIPDDIREMLITGAIDVANSDPGVALPDISRFLGDYRVSKLTESYGFNGELTGISGNDGVCTFSFADGSKIHSFSQGGTRYGVLEDKNGCFSLDTSKKEPVINCPPSIFVDFGVDVAALIKGNPLNPEAGAPSVDVSEFAVPALTEKDVTVTNRNTAEFSTDYCLEAGWAFKKMWFDDFGEEINIQDVKGWFTTDDNSEYGRGAAIQFRFTSPTIGELTVTDVITGTNDTLFEREKCFFEYSSYVNGVCVPFRYTVSMYTPNYDEKDRLCDLRFQWSLEYTADAILDGHAVSVDYCTLLFVWMDYSSLSSSYQSTVSYDYMGTHYGNNVSSIRLNVWEGKTVMYIVEQGGTAIIRLTGKIKFSENKTKVNPAIYDAAGGAGISA